MSTSATPSRFKRSDDTYKNKTTTLFFKTILDGYMFINFTKQYNCRNQSHLMIT